MATCREKPDTRRRTEAENPAENRAELSFTVTGTTDENEALFAVAAEAPLTYEGMPRRAIDLNELGGGVWEASVPYANRETTPPGSSTFEFDTSGGTAHITQAKAVISSHAPPSYPTLPNSFGVIGATRDSVEGCDIVVPVYAFAERHIIHASSVTGAYKANLFSLTGRTNAASFKGFAIGEVLFMGAQGSKRGYDDWEISFRFVASPNVTGLTIGEITGVNKKGWEYLWIRYTDDESDGNMVKKPLFAYVVRVYDSGNFSLLGIGT